MIESKILNWMLRGPIQLADVYRSIEPGLLLESFNKNYKGVLRAVQEYHSKYKTPPSPSILAGMLSEKDQAILESICEDDCAQNEIQFYVDELKKAFNKHLANEVARIIEASDDNLGNINQNLRNVVVKIEKLGKNAVFSEGSFTDSIQERVDDYLYTRNNPNQVMGVFWGFKALYY